MKFIGVESNINAAISSAKMNGILSVLCPTNGIVKMYEF
jgi:hypothetical protein